MAKPLHNVIIGNAAAAVGCVEGIRQHDRKSKITIISDETHHTYSRPLISYLLCGKTDRERMKYRPDRFYTENGCQTILGVRAESIDPNSKAVSLSDGQTIGYDRLLLATGSHPFVPSIPGLDAVDKQCTFLSLSDAEKLENMLTPESRVLIMGAGLIGLKCAEGIAERVGGITVVDLADHILPSILDHEAASLVQRHIETQGVRFILSDSVVSFDTDRAVLQSGRILPFDLLVVAVGVRPNTALAAAAGAEIGRGIKTDAHCRTSLLDIYAAGDCAESFDITVGSERVLALLPNAYMQGETAGINMAGGDRRYDHAIPMNAIGFFGLHIMTAGCCDGKSLVTKAENSYRKFVTDANRLKGYILIGDVRRAGIYTALIREQRSLDSLDFPLLLEKPQLMAFSRKERNKILGGEKQ